MGIRFAAMIALPLAALVAGAQDIEWPKELETESGTVVVYQPQIETLDGNSLDAMAAVAVKTRANGDSPVFGAVWLQARLDTDRNTRTATIRDISITDVRFADATDEDKGRLAAFLEESVRDAAISISMDQVLADLDESGAGIAEKSLKHDPPKILLSTTPAMLVSIDGEPAFRDIEGSMYERVINTPFLIIRGGRDHYLYTGGGAWYSSRAIEGPWMRARSVPAEIAGMVEQSDEPTEDIGDVEVVVAKEPTELIVSAGPPSWAPVEGMNLLYMDNTDSNVFLELSTQSYYVLLSGRWFRGEGVVGDLGWTHVPNDELPQPFTDIPADSVNGAVLSQVAGTQQARDAVLDNAIPQTAAIDRGATSFSVNYDGAPEFDDVENIQVQYAVNTEAAVFRYGNLYYACDQGVWYVANSATGPWTVATEVPDAIYDLPVSNPHHNVTYVKVYDVTPEVVYVGYTPAYFGSYYYHGSVIYGTGWYYSPWWGPYYYPRYPTWGFHVTYNPWTGWGLGVSWGYGPFRITVGGGGYYGWFGPGGYRPYPRPYVGAGYRKTNININVDNSINIGGRDRPQARPNLYDRPENLARNADRSRLPATREARTAADLRNNVVADRSGNVYQRGADGSWSQRDKGQWQSPANLDRAGGGPGASVGDMSRPGSAAQTPSARQPLQRDRGGLTGPSQSSGFGPSTGATRPQLERDFGARQHGAQRAQNFQRAGGAGRAPARRPR